MKKEDGIMNGYIINRLVRNGYIKEEERASYQYGTSGRYSVGIWRTDRVELRSEERRVGKECRSRWSPYH